MKDDTISIPVTVRQMEAIQGNIVDCGGFDDPGDPRDRFIALLESLGPGQARLELPIDLARWLLDESEYWGDPRNWDEWFGTDKQSLWQVHGKIEKALLARQRRV